MIEISSNVIDFTGKNRQEKKQIVLTIIAKLTNFNPGSLTCDWSTPMMPLHIPNETVLSFVDRLNWDITLID